MTLSRSARCPSASWDLFTGRGCSRVFRSLISSDLTRMTDNERDQIDQDAQIFMRTCSEAIRQLRLEGARRLHRDAPAEASEGRRRLY